MGRQHHAALAAALPVREQIADYVGIPLPETVGREPELTRDPGIYVSGPRAADFIALLSARTGLPLRQDQRGALVIDGPTGIFPAGSSVTLRARVIETITSNQNSIQVIAVNGSNRIPFDSESRAFGADPSLANQLDMDDFDAASGVPEFQAAMLGHILTERSTPGSYMSAHQAAIETERTILQEMTGLTLTSRPLTIPSTSLRVTAVEHTSTDLMEGFDLFDYGPLKYRVIVPTKPPDSTGFREPIMSDVRRVDRITVP